LKKIFLDFLNIIEENLPMLIAERCERQKLHNFTFASSVWQIQSGISRVKIRFKKLEKAPLVLLK
jgi:hypothetical protein